MSENHRIICILYTCLHISYRLTIFVSFGLIEVFVKQNQQWPKFCTKFWRFSVSAVQGNSFEKNLRVSMFICLVCPQHLSVQRCQTRTINIQSRTPTVYWCQTRVINIQSRTYSQILAVSNQRYKYSIFDCHFRKIFPEYLSITTRGRHPTSRRFYNGFFHNG
jgi:hypothetical protein